MYALYKKYPVGNAVEVEIITVSDNEDALKALLPFEVEIYLRGNNKKMLPDELAYSLPHGNEPLSHWTSRAFGAVEFEVCEIPGYNKAYQECMQELIKLRKENNEYLKSIGIK
jgi:hypothetical protein